MILQRKEHKKLKAVAMSWTSYIIAHLFKAKLQRDSLIIVLVPSKEVQSFVDKSIALMCEQSYEAWQLETRIATVH